MRRAGFTFIELLLVISIIAILMGIILAAIPLVKQAMYVAKTKTIMHSAIVAISTAAMRTGATIAPVVHPLANSMVVPSTMNRSLFLRSTTASFINVGDPVDTTSEALSVSNPNWVYSTEQPRLLLPGDVYCGLSAPSSTDDPLIFAMQRTRLTILGSSFGLVCYRRLPTLSPIYDPASKGWLEGPPYNGTTSPAYPDSQFLYQTPGDLTDPAAFELDDKKTFDFMMGPEAGAELSSLGGIVTDDQNTPSTALISYNRLRAWPNVGGQTFTTYSEGYSTKAPQVLDSDGNWKPYHLRGPALYDAWGREMLYFRADNGSAVMESAGPDGYFAIAPGASNCTYATPAYASAVVSPDLDATRDNITSNGQK